MKIMSGNIVQIKQADAIRENQNMGFMVASNLQDAIKISEIISTSGICPTQYKGKAADVLVAMQMGAELGLKPMQALQNIAVINGKPSIYGDAALAVCRQSKDFEKHSETYSKTDNSYTCMVKRRNEDEPFVQKFSEEDARKANLWGKQGPWTQYPKRMLQMRARGFCLRDAFPEMLKGFITTEEAQDYPAKAYNKPQEKVVEAVIQVGTADTAVVTRSINEQELDILKFKIKEAGENETNICALMKIDCLESFPSDKWAAAIRSLDKKIVAKQKAASLPINNAIKEAAKTEPVGAVDPDVAAYFNEQ